MRKASFLPCRCVLRAQSKPIQSAACITYRSEGPAILVDGHAGVDHHARADAEVEAGAVGGQQPVHIHERDAGGDLHAFGGEVVCGAV